MRENRYQAEVISKLRVLLPGCFILKNDSGYMQGVPDLLVLYKDRWAMLEVKASEREPFQPNQEYYLEMLDEMSFATVICPENEEEILNALQSAFTARRQTRLSKR